jgi:hypothetical protein
VSTLAFDRIMEEDSHAELMAHGGMSHDPFKFQTNAFGFAPRASPESPKPPSSPIGRDRWNRR